MSKLTYETANAVVKAYVGTDDKRNKDMILGFILGIMGRIKFDESGSEPERKSA